MGGDSCNDSNSTYLGNYFAHKCDAAYVFYAILPRKSQAFGQTLSDLITV